MPYNNAPATIRMLREPKIVAIVAARNEADIIHQTVGDLVRQGIGVYVIDHGSSDGTASAVAAFVGRGLIGIESFSTATPSSGGDTFALARILARKEQLTRELDADWYINHDADEFRESPWRHLNLRQGIELVDRLGYSAIDFALLNFWPTHDAFRPEDDVRESFRHYEVGASWDRVQIRCWKNTDAAVDLVSTAGHAAEFQGRRVFPIRFLLRHYPIRGQAHGTRKVFQDRLPRFDPAERQRGWHVQYDALEPQHTFVRSASELSLYDADAVRVDLHLGPVHDAARAPDLDRRVAALEQQAVDLSDRSAALTAELDQQRRQAETLRAALDDVMAELGRERENVRAGADRLVMTAARADDLAASLATARHERDHLQRLVAALHASVSWKLTAPMRAAWRLFDRRNQS